VTLFHVTGAYVYMDPYIGHLGMSGLGLICERINTAVLSLVHLSRLDEVPVLQISEFSTLYSHESWYSISSRVVCY